MSDRSIGLLQQRLAMVQLLFLAVLSLPLAATNAFAEGSVAVQSEAAGADFLTNLPVGERPVGVCVVDTGIDPLEAADVNLLASAHADGVSTADDVSPDLHGTRVTQMMAQTWKPLPIVVVKVADEGPFDADIYSQAVQECVNQKTIRGQTSLAMVVFSVPVNSLSSTAELAALETVLDIAKSNGLISIAAVGNESSSVVSYPAAFDDVFGVGAFDAVGGGLCSTSNFGTGTDLFAPGCGLELFDSTGVAVDASGSEYAAAFVAATAAAMLSHDASLTPQQATQALVDSATASDEGVKLNAEEAFDLVGLGELVATYKPGGVTIPTPIPEPPRATQPTTTTPSHSTTQAQEPPPQIYVIPPLPRPRVLRSSWRGSRLTIKLKEIPEYATVVARYNGRIKRIKGTKIKGRTLKLRTKRGSKRVTVRLRFTREGNRIGPILKRTFKRR